MSLFRLVLILSHLNFNVKRMEMMLPLLLQLRMTTMMITIDMTHLEQTMIIQITRTTMKLWEVNSVVMPVSSTLVVALEKAVALVVSVVEDPKPHHRPEITTFILRMFQ